MSQLVRQALPTILVCRECRMLVQRGVNSEQHAQHIHGEYVTSEDEMFKVAPKKHQLKEEKR